MMIKLLRENYLTYIDVATTMPERHFVRLSAFGILSLTFALLSESMSAASAMMATGLTVLTGFTFSALFSDHAMAFSGLPPAKTEDDRHDLKKLKELAQNFKSRSAYFIALSTFEIVLLAAVSFDLSMPSFLEDLRVIARRTGSFLGSVQPQFPDSGGIFSAFVVIISFFVIFIYLECIYTFYRMAETILAIVDRRRSYLSERVRIK